jgi:hypothetical protein
MGESAYETTIPPGSTGPVPDDLRDTRGIVTFGRLERLLPGSNWGVTDLQSVAFPLGEGALFLTLLLSSAPGADLSLGEIS